MWLVIGYGNSLRGDDGSGPHLIELLRLRLPEFQAQLIVCQQLVPELVELLIQPTVAKVLFVDVQRGQLEPFTLLPVTGAGTAQPVTHQFGPELLLAMAATLYRQPRRGWLLSLCGSNFAHGQGLSAKTLDAVDSAADWVERLLRSASR